MNILTLHIAGSIITLVTCAITWFGIVSNKRLLMIAGIKTLWLLTVFQIITGVIVAWTTQTQSLLGVCARLGFYVAAVYFTYFCAKAKILKLQSIYR